MNDVTGNASTTNLAPATPEPSARVVSEDEYTGRHREPS
jgi:hypothetical protein